MASATTMRAAEVKAPGPPDVLHVGTRPKPTPAAGEVLIKVYATAVNRADTLQRAGSYPPPPGASDILGLEAVGVIEGVGQSCRLHWKQGDRVCALLGGGGYAEYVAVDERHVFAQPPSFTHIQSAAIPEVWLTAFQILHTVAHVRAGDVVLVHAAGSGVGTSAIQLAVAAKATVIATAGSQSKLDHAKKLGAAATFLRDSEWEKSVMEFTKGHGADVIMDCVGGSYASQNAAAAAMDARWVLYGLMGGSKAGDDFLKRLMAKRIQLLSTTLRSRSADYKAELVAAFQSQVLPKFASKEFEITVDTVMPFEDVAKAHALVESNGTTGKVILQIRQDA